MGYVVVALVVGTAFILAGRWVYANPKKLFEGSLQTPGGGPFMRFWVRFFGAMLIFGGAFTVVAQPASLVLHSRTLVALLGAVAAVLGVVFLRPRSVGDGRATSEPSSQAAPRRGASQARKGKLFVVTMVVGGLAVSAEAILLPRLGGASMWPDAALLTVLVVAAAMLSEMLFVK